MTLKLEVGKFYKSKCGKKGWCYYKDEESFHRIAWEGCLNDGVYNGIYKEHNREINDSYKIASEWPDENPLSKFTVGSKWVDEFGDILTVRRTDWQITFYSAVDEDQLATMYYNDGSKDYIDSLTPYAEPEKEPEPANRSNSTGLNDVAVNYGSDEDIDRILMTLAMLKIIAK